MLIIAYFLVSYRAKTWWRSARVSTQWTLLQSHTYSSFAPSQSISIYDPTTSNPSASNRELTSCFFPIFLFTIWGYTLCLLPHPHIRMPTASHHRAHVYSVAVAAPISRNPPPRLLHLCCLGASYDLFPTASACTTCESCQILPYVLLTMQQSEFKRLVMKAYSWLNCLVVHVIDGLNIHLLHQHGCLLKEAIWELATVLLDQIIVLLKVLLIRCE